MTKTKNMRRSCNRRDRPVYILLRWELSIKRKVLKSGRESRIDTRKSLLRDFGKMRKTIV